MAYLEEFAARRQERMATMGAVHFTKKDRKDKQKPANRLVKGQVREILMDRIFDAMEDWRFSQFEFEGTARAAVRSAFCLNGFSWAHSDADADALVQAVLRRMGAERPTPKQAGPEYTIGRENCQNYLCAAPLSEEQQNNGNRFCSESCFKFVSVHRSQVIRWHEREVYAHGWYESWKASTAVSRRCERTACSKEYRSPFPDQKYCSYECANEAQRKPERRRQCEAPGCTNVFVDHQSGGRTQRFCSIACKEAGRATVSLNCLQCHEPFEAKATTGRAAPKYCSASCRKLFNKNKVIRERKEKRALDKAVHISAFRCDPA